MIELVILACLLKDPQQCREFSVPFFEPTNVAQCAVRAALHSAQWAADHPDWTIRRWTCGAPRA